MTDFCIKLAGIPLAVHHAAFDSTKDFFRDYLTEEPPLFSVTMTPEDMEEMRRQDRRTAIAEGRTPREQPARLLETLAFCRLITAELISFQVLLFHGSAVVYDGKVYLFTAKSGTGKTTHSRLWLKLIPGSYILNGDKPLLLFKEGRIFVCGSPWMGKEKYGRNEILPLEALCFLERDTVNHIEEISLNACVKPLLGQCHIPEGSKNFLSGLRLIKQFSAVKIYRLGCNMADSAAQVSFQKMVMKGKTFEDVLRENGSLFFKSVGCSMRPLIREGKDFIYIIRRPEERLKKFDAVLFIRPDVTGRGRYVLHRILKVNPDGTYWIAGDNCTSGETVREEHILGVLSAVRRGSRTIRVTDPGYKLYVRFWCAPWPVRFFILNCKRILRRTAGKILKGLLHKK